MAKDQYFHQKHPVNQIFILQNNNLYFNVKIQHHLQILGNHN